MHRIETPSPASFFGRSTATTGHFTFTRHQGRSVPRRGDRASRTCTATAASASRIVPVPGPRTSAGRSRACPTSQGGARPRSPWPAPMGCTRSTARLPCRYARPATAPTEPPCCCDRSSIADTSVDWARSTASPRFAGKTASGSTKARVDGIIDQIRTLHENADGSLWAGTAGGWPAAGEVCQPPAPGRRDRRPRRNISAPTTGCPTAA